MAFTSVRRALVTAVVSAGLLVATPGIANAGETWYWGDGFEGDPALTWAFDWGGNFQTAAGRPRTGQKNAYLPVNSDFVSVRTTLPIPSWVTAYEYSCEATAWVRAVTNSGGYTTADINFEIIDEPSWYGMTVTNHKVNVGAWTKISSGSWSSGDETPALRVSLLRDSAALRVDDVEVTCYTYDPLF
jgi:hypothetical protein